MKKNDHRILRFEASEISSGVPWAIMCSHLVVAIMSSFVGLAFSLPLGKFISPSLIDKITLGPFFLLPMAAGALFGILAAILNPTPWIRWVWLPFTFMVLVLLAFGLTHAGQGSAASLFGQHDGMDFGLQLFLTAPWLSCITYSIAGSTVVSQKDKDKTNNRENDV